MTELPRLPAESIEAVRNICDPCSVQISIDKDGLFAHHSTGLLFAVGDHHFIATCRHSVHGVVAGNAGLWVGNDSTGKLDPLDVKFLYLKPDLWDLAIAKLPDRFAPCFSKHRFARASDTISSRQPTGISCAMYGALSSASGTWDSNVSSDDELIKMCAYIGRTTTVDRESEYIDDAIHFLSDADNFEWSRETNDGKSKLISPEQSIKGLSGAPVFAVNDNPFEPNWIAHDYRIIGIQSALITLRPTTCNPTRRAVLRIVRIEVLFALIRELFPSVRELLDKLDGIEAIIMPNRSKIVIPGA